ncbi:MAG TPA: hypothetical protein VGI58_10415 [Streptosporangiaceae bacterium]
MSDELGLGLGLGGGDDESDGLDESGGGEVDGLDDGGDVGEAAPVGSECVDPDRFDDGLELGEVGPEPKICEAGDWDVAPPGPPELPGPVRLAVRFGPKLFVVDAGCWTSKAA